jgi:hypothetical protein
MKSSRGTKRLAHGLRMGGCNLQKGLGSTTRAAGVLLPLVKRADADPDELRKLGLAEAHGAADGGRIGITGMDRRCGQ